jgi:hypothetical protein
MPTYNDGMGVRASIGARAAPALATAAHDHQISRFSPSCATSSEYVEAMLQHTSLHDFTSTVLKIIEEYVGCKTLSDIQMHYSVTLDPIHHCTLYSTRKESKPFRQYYLELLQAIKVQDRLQYCHCNKHFLNHIVTEQKRNPVIIPADFRKVEIIIGLTSIINELINLELYTRQYFTPEFSREIEQYRLEAKDAFSRDMGKYKGELAEQNRVTREISAHEDKIKNLAQSRDLACADYIKHGEIRQQCSANLYFLSNQIEQLRKILLRGL